MKTLAKCIARRASMLGGLNKISLRRCTVSKETGYKMSHLHTGTHVVARRNGCEVRRINEVAER